jgi:hypothetical protein
MTAPEPVLQRAAPGPAGARRLLQIEALDKCFGQRTCCARSISISPTTSGWS